MKDIADYDAFSGADGGMPLPVIDGLLPDQSDSYLPRSTDVIFSSGDFNTDIEVLIGKKLILRKSLKATL